MNNSYQDKEYYIIGHDGYTSYYMEIVLSGYIANRLMVDFKEYRVWRNILISGLAPVDCYDSIETRDYLYGEYIVHDDGGQPTLSRPYIRYNYPTLSIVLQTDVTDIKRYDRETDTFDPFLDIIVDRYSRTGSRGLGASIYPGVREALINDMLPLKSPYYYYSKYLDS